MAEYVVHIITRMDVTNEGRNTDLNTSKNVDEKKLLIKIIKFPG